MAYTLRFRKQKGEATGEKTDDGSYILTNKNKGDRGFFYLVPKLRVEPGDQVLFSGSVTGEGTTLALFYSEIGADRPSGSIKLSESPGELKKTITVPSGTAAIRFDFRLYGPVGESRLDDFLIVQTDDNEGEPGKVELVNFPETTGLNFTLEWAPADLADSYHVIAMQEAGDWIEAGKTDGTSWDFTFDPAEIGTWCFRVDAVNASGSTPGDVACLDVEMPKPGKVELIDFDPYTEQDYYALFWFMPVPGADRFIVMMAQEGEAWAEVGATAELYIDLDLRQYEIGEWGLRVDAENDNGVTEGDVETLMIDAKKYPVPDVQVPELIGVSGYKWPGGNISLVIDGVEVPEVVDPETGEVTPGGIFYGIEDPEGRPLPITGFLDGRDGHIVIDSLSPSPVEAEPCDPEIDPGCDDTEEDSEV